MPVRPGNPHPEVNMAGVKYHSDRPEDGTAVVSGEINRPDGDGVTQDGPVGTSDSPPRTISGQQSEGAAQAEKPNKSDDKGTWESYAKAQGVDTSGMTKDEIIEAVG